MEADNFTETAKNNPFSVNLIFREIISERGKFPSFTENAPFP